MNFKFRAITLGVLQGGPVLLGQGPNQEEQQSPASERCTSEKTKAPKQLAWITGQLFLGKRKLTLLISVRSQGTCHFDQGHEESLKITGKPES